MADINQQILILSRMGATVTRLDSGGLKAKFYHVDFDLEMSRKIADLNQTEELQIYGSRISEQEIKIISESATIQRLLLAFCPRIGKEVIPLIKRMPRLRKIGLLDTGISPIDAKALMAEVNDRHTESK